MKRQRIGKVLVWSGASDKESVSIAVSNRQAHFNNDVKLEVRICGVTKRIGIKEVKEYRANGCPVRITKGNKTEIL